MVFTAPEIPVTDLAALAEHTIGVLTGTLRWRPTAPVAVAFLRLNDRDGHPRLLSTSHTVFFSSGEILKAVEKPDSVLVHLTDRGPVDLLAGTDRAETTTLTHRLEMLPSGAVVMAGAWNLAETPDELGTLAVKRVSRAGGCLDPRPWAVAGGVSAFRADKRFDHQLRRICWLDLTPLAEDVHPASAIYLADLRILAAPAVLRSITNQHQLFHP